MRSAPCHRMLLVLLLAAVLGAVPGRSEEPLVARGDHNFPPYEFIEGGRPTGFNVELLQAVAETMGLRVRVDLGPWAEVRAQIEGGSIDIVTGMFHSPERERTATFSAPFITVFHAIFTRPNTDVAALDDLRGRSVIVQRGDIMHDFVRETGLTSRVVTVEAPEDALRLLSSGRHDGALLIKLQGVYLARKYGLTNVTTVGAPVASRDYCFAVRRGDGALAARLTEGLRILRATGRYDELHHRWFGSLDDHEAWEALGRRAAPVVGLLLVLLGAALAWSRALRRQVARRTAELQRELLAREAAQRELVDTHERLRAAERMESLGRLAGGVAHDLNNILSGLVSLPDLLADDATDPAMREGLLDIRAAGLRAAAIVTDLLALARRETATRHPLDLNDLLRRHLGSPEIGRIRADHPTVRLETDLAPDLPPVRGARHGLTRALTNLVLNAMEASPPEGTVLVATEADTSGERPVVVLSVADQGPGVPRDIRHHVFEPFFSRKGQGRSGTGLGLAVVWGTAVDHEGTVAVDDAPGGGALFTLRLPASDAAPLDASPPPAPTTGQGQTVLVVDDLADQRDLLVRSLTNLGYRPRAVADGETALASLAEATVDLVILDMVMPGGIDGLETCRRILDTRPGQRILVVSGYAEGDRIDRVLALGAVGLLPKPWLVDDLARAVTKALAAATGG